MYKNQLQKKKWGNVRKKLLLEGGWGGGRHLMSYNKCHIFFLFGGTFPLSIICTGVYQRWHWSWKGGKNTALHL